MSRATSLLFLQRDRLRRAYPDAKCDVVRHRTLRWRGWLQPNPYCCRYLMSVEYSPPAAPKVRVLEPELEVMEGCQLPHVYSDGSLCLYLPRAREWTGSMWLTDTLIPWASEWLLHYELWLATGEWHGGGAHG